MATETVREYPSTPGNGASITSRTLVFIYSIFAYAVGCSSLVALILWMTGLLPVGLPLIAQGPVFDSSGVAIAWNLAWVIGFGYKHTAMARPRFKNWYSQYFPEASVRSTYVLATGVYLLPMLYFWSPMPASVWQAEGITHAILLALGGLGWVILFAATFTIDHFELFGLRQGWEHLRGRPVSSPHFVQRGLYRYIRHPIMTGMLLGIWFVPEMSAQKLLMTLALTAYVFIGLWFEERALKRTLGADYEEYSRQVGRLLPRLGR
ncbi:methyltransferase family protein [Microbulbifer sp. SA54]|uniref:methyltransferase family protein n=1 Tax=Microbulbifer sp. SA54 TaxID=3401577 RepID=UPI003AABEA24